MESSIVLLSNISYAAISEGPINNMEYEQIQQFVTFFYLSTFFFYSTTFSVQILRLIYKKI